MDEVQKNDGLVQKSERIFDALGNIGAYFCKL
jgi:hypothetical protein